MTFSPDIVISDTDAFILKSVVQREASNRHVLDFLDQEIARATVVPTGKVGPRVARLGAMVTAIKYPGATSVHGILVADDDMKRNTAPTLPITTMEGAALIGLQATQSIEYYDCDGNLCRLDVVTVEEPDAEISPVPNEPVRASWPEHMLRFLAAWIERFKR